MKWKAAWRGPPRESVLDWLLLRIFISNDGAKIIVIAPAHDMSLTETNEQKNRIRIQDGAHKLEGWCRKKKIDRWVTRKH